MQRTALRAAADAERLAARSLQSPDPDAKDIVAEGEAAADAWRQTLLFIKK